MPGKHGLCLAAKQQEKQELEEQRVALMEEVQSYRNKIKQLEDDLLFRLSNSQARAGPALVAHQGLEFRLPPTDHRPTHILCVCACLLIVNDVIL